MSKQCETRAGNWESELKFRSGGWEEGEKPLLGLNVRTDAECACPWGFVYPCSKRTLALLCGHHCAGNNIQKWVTLVDRGERECSQMYKASFLILLNGMAQLTVAVSPFEIQTNFIGLISKRSVLKIFFPPCL